MIQANFVQFNLKPIVWFQHHVAIGLEYISSHLLLHIPKIRRGSRTAATSKMEHFVIIVKDGMRVTIITKSFILDVAAVLHPALKNKK